MWILAVLHTYWFLLVVFRIVENTLRVKNRVKEGMISCLRESFLFRVLSNLLCFCCFVCFLLGNACLLDKDGCTCALSRRFSRYLLHTTVRGRCFSSLKLFLTVYIPDRSYISATVFSALDFCNLFKFLYNFWKQLFPHESEQINIHPPLQNPSQNASSCLSQGHFFSPVMLVWLRLVFPTDTR